MSSSTSNLRNSIQLPLSSSTLTRPEDVKVERLPYTTNRFGWPKQTDRESSPSVTEHVPVGRSTIYAPPSENYRSDYGGSDEEIMEDDFEDSVETHEQKNFSRFEKPDTQMKPIVEVTDDLNALLEVTFSFFYPAYDINLRVNHT